MLVEESPERDASMSKRVGLVTGKYQMTGVQDPEHGRADFVLEERDRSRCIAPKSASVQLRSGWKPFVMRFWVQDPEHDVSEELQQDPRDAHESITGSSPFI
jgi:hypothetical protein